jgi:hypothetical protein
LAIGAPKDDAEAFAIAFIEITAALDEEVSCILQERVVQGDVVINRQRLGEFSVIKDFANEHGCFDAFTLER